PTSYPTPSSSCGVIRSTIRLISRQPSANRHQLEQESQRILQMNEFLHWEPGEEPPDLNLAEATERLASRVVLIDDRQRVLLLKWLRPDGDAVWITPGGALEAGESFEEAAVRELWEETGLRDVVLAEQVWESANFFSIQGKLIRSEHHYFVARVGPVLISNANMDELERAVNGEHKWWPLD